jgi:hypothetical protein
VEIGGENDNNNQLELPWGDEKWNLYITNPVNTHEVWARLNVPGYSVSYNQVLFVKFVLV